MEHDVNNTKPVSTTVASANNHQLSSDERTSLIENNGIDIITEAERTAQPSDLFWPWFAANVSVFGISYASFVYGFGVSFFQALIVVVIGVTISFALCGIIAIAGKRGSAPTMILSRAAFGVYGQKIPGIFSWLMSIGWETFLAIMATLATATVFTQMGWSGGTTTKIVACLIIAAMIVSASVAGYHIIMKVQSILTWITGTLTIVYILLTVRHIDFSIIMQRPAGSLTAVIGALVMVMTGFGLGWINIAADWSRYQSRQASAGKIVAWNTAGGAISPILLIATGLLIVGSNPELVDGIAADPIGTLATILPTWVLLPFLVTAVLGLVSGAVLGIYSSGLTLLSLGVKVSRPAAAGIDGIILTTGTIWVVFFAQDFLGPFQSFLITLGVPIASWAGLMMADIALRQREYDEQALFDPRGIYGAWDWASLVVMGVASGIGWGLVINNFAEEAAWNNWQGYLLGPLGLGGRDGDWAWANLGVLCALVLSFAGGYLLRRRKVARQEKRR
ncbi:purine-cytosine permease family protein [Arcanobacterium buesumense]|uniref:Allantoin permease n=1 Tax=Arcanobacterium buesumense TaxID=2722751 RepID=A0A6H2EN37_9ACTO|nr:cytosine permease [Arcanobacterium buesumense]QJC22490.1 allantoin permease [Arcanobacterium buesumense]